MQLKQKTMKISVIFMALVFLSGTLMASTKDDKKKEIPSSGGPAEGVVYSLPETGIRIHVKATRDHFVCGPFNLYAKKMLGIDNAPSANSDQWTIDDIKIETFGEPDADQVHKAMGPAASLLSLTQSGILAGINTGVKTEESEPVTQTFLSNNAGNQVNFTDLSIWSFYTPADSTNKNKLVSKSQEQKAAEAAETILNLRNSRFSLLTNADDEPLPDGKAFEVMTKELGKMEKNYLALFIGKSTKKTYEFSFDFVPGNKTEKGEVVFRFSDDRGVLPKTDLSGRPIVIEMVKADNLAAKQSSFTASDNPDAGKSGIFYRMPGLAEIRILDGSAELAGSRATIAQFGTVAPVPESFLDGDYKLEFFPATGAIKSITEKE